MTNYFGASLIPMILGLISNPWIAKNMSPEDYAISGYYTSFNALLQPVIVFYMVHFFIKEFYRINTDQQIKLFAAIAKALMWFSGVVSVICFIGVLGYLKIFNTESTLPISPYLAMTVFSLPLCGLFNLVQARHRMNRQSKAFFRLTVLSGTLSICLSIIFVVFIKWGAFGKLLAPLISNTTIFIVLLLKYRHQIFIPTHTSEYKRILLFCWPLAVSAMLGYFTNGYDRTYLETLGDNTAYGYYIVGASIATYLSTFSTAIGNTFQPDLYEAVVKKQWHRYMRFIIADLGCIAITVIVFILLCPYIIDILTAGRYVASTPYSQIIALSTFTSATYFITNNFSITTNRPKLYLITSILGSLIIIIAMPIMVNNWGFFGGAWMTVLSFVGFTVINILLLVLSKKITLLNG